MASCHVCDADRGVQLSAALEKNAPSQNDWSASSSLIAVGSCERLTFAISPSCCCLLFQCPISEKLVPNRVVIGCFQSPTFTLLHPRWNTASSTLGRPPSSAWTSHWCGRNMKWRETLDFLEMHLVARCVSNVVSLCTDGSLRVSPHPAHRRATSLVRSTKLQGQTQFSSAEAVKKGQSICPNENSAGTSICAAK